MPLTPGTRIGAYEVGAPLGTGGMGEVYLARDIRLNRQVALKTLLDGHTEDQELVARLEREAQMLAVLNHPNIAQIYSIEEISGGLALVMELVEGPTLAERILRGPVGMAEAILIATQLASALEYAHSRGVIHRDLKPANIKVTADGTVKVLDFGLAKKQQGSPGIDTAKMTAAGLTQPGTVFGTPGYMAPELLRGKPADVRSDIFAFGVVLFELLTGHHPFLRPSVFEVAEAILNPAPAPWPATPLPIPEVVQFVVRKAIAKDPSLRYQSIHELRSDLMLSSGSYPVAAAPTHSSGSFPELTETVPVTEPLPATAIQSARRTQRWLMIASALCVIAIVAGGIAIWMLMQ
jgi:serine/threonine protein kinase